MFQTCIHLNSQAPSAEIGYVMKLQSTRAMGTVKEIVRPALEGFMV